MKDPSGQLATAATPKSHHKFSSKKREGDIAHIWVGNISTRNLHVPSREHGFKATCYINNKENSFDTEVSASGGSTHAWHGVYSLVVLDLETELLTVEIHNVTTGEQCGIGTFPLTGLTRAVPREVWIPLVPLTEFAASAPTACVVLYTTDFGHDVNVPENAVWDFRRSHPAVQPWENITEEKLQLPFPLSVALSGVGALWLDRNELFCGLVSPPLSQRFRKIRFKVHSRKLSQQYSPRSSSTPSMAAPSQLMSLPRYRAEHLTMDGVELVFGIVPVTASTRKGLSSQGWSYTPHGGKIEEKDRILGKAASFCSGPIKDGETFTFVLKDNNVLDIFRNDKKVWFAWEEFGKVKIHWENTLLCFGVQVLTSRVLIELDRDYILEHLPPLAITDGTVNSNVFLPSDSPTTQQQQLQQQQAAAAGSPAALPLVDSFDNIKRRPFSADAARSRTLRRLPSLITTATRGQYNNSLGLPSPSTPTTTGTTTTPASRIGLHQQMFQTGRTPTLDQDALLMMDPMDATIHDGSLAATMPLVADTPTLTTVREKEPDGGRSLQHVGINTPSPNSHHTTTTPITTHKRRAVGNLTPTPNHSPSIQSSKGPRRSIIHVDPNSNYTDLTCLTPLQVWASTMDETIQNSDNEQQTQQQLLFDLGECTLHQILENGTLPSESELQSAYNALDTDGSGQLTRNEFRILFSHMEHFGVDRVTAMKFFDGAMNDTRAQIDSNYIATRAERAATATATKQTHGFDLFSDDTLTYQEFVLIVLKLLKQ